LVFDLRAEKSTETRILNRADINHIRNWSNSPQSQPSKGFKGPGLKSQIGAPQLRQLNAEGDGAETWIPERRPDRRRLRRMRALWRRVVGPAARNPAPGGVLCHTTGLPVINRLVMPGILFEFISF